MSYCPLCHNYHSKYSNHIYDNNSRKRWDRKGSAKRKAKLEKNKRRYGKNE